MYCATCGDDDHYTAECELRLGAPRNEPALLPQHARCWRCHHTVYAWDHMPCGQHAVVGAERYRCEPPPVTPPRHRARDLQALALAQVADARAQRAVLDLDQPRHVQHADDQHSGGGQGQQDQPRDQ